MDRTTRRLALAVLGSWACGPSAPAEADDAAPTGDSTGDDEQPATDDEGGSVSGADETGPAEVTDGGSDSGSTGEPVDPPDPYEAKIIWTPCPVYTGGGGSGAECAEIDLPLHWSDPEGETISVFVKRIGDHKVGKQLWMLMGGPGGASAGYESLAVTLTDADDDLVVYLPDHRGVGRSTRLGCPAAESPGSAEGMRITPEEWPGCIEDLERTWGEGLDGFGTSSAARDLGWLIERIRVEPQSVHVFGGSYGTYWAHRYLQLHPAQASSATLLGIAGPSFDFARYTEHYDAAGRRFMGECSDDPVCSARLGPDAEKTMEEIMGAVDGDLCPPALAAGLDREALKLYFSSRLSWSWSERALIPATLYRLQRCSPADVAALEYAAPSMMDPLAGLLDDPLFSSVINVHVSLSEMWHPPIPTVEDAQQAAANALFGLGSAETRVTLDPVWPKYPHDEYVGEYAATDVPMLMMVGEYDPNSPVDEGIEFATHFTGPDQHFFVIPGGSHGWDSPTSQGYGCAINVFFNFIQDPQQSLLDCWDDVLPMDFAGAPGLAESFFGTSDLYDG